MKQATVIVVAALAAVEVAVVTLVVVMITHTSFQVQHEQVSTGSYHLFENLTDTAQKGFLYAEPNMHFNTNTLM